jgi:hypothetical protein
MEIIFSILLVLSMAGNYFQHEKVKDLKVKYEVAITASGENLESYKVALKANEEDEIVIKELEEDLANCNGKLQTEIDKINNWKESDRLKSFAIEDLTERLDGVDFGAMCRMPNWVDFEASSNSIRN